MRFGVEISQVIVGLRDSRVRAGGHAMQRWIHHGEIGLPHRCSHVNDRVAGDAAQAVLRFGVSSCSLIGARNGH